MKNIIMILILVTFTLSTYIIFRVVSREDSMETDPIELVEVAIPKALYGSIDALIERGREVSISRVYNSDLSDEKREQFLSEINELSFERFIIALLEQFAEGVKQQQAQQQAQALIRDIKLE